MPSKLIDNKTQLKKVLASVQETCDTNATTQVFSINDRTDDVVVELSDFYEGSMQCNFSEDNERKTLALCDNKNIVIDFSKIKSITIPEGNVKEIYSGETLLWTEPKLPDEYQRVTYIRKPLTSNAYIDLGFPYSEVICNYPPGIRMTYIKNSSNSYYLFGAAENDMGTRCMITEGNNVTAYGYLGAASYTGISIASGEDTVGVEQKLGYWVGEGFLQLSINSETVGGRANGRYYSFLMKNNLYLFAQNYNGAPRISGDFSILSFSYYGGISNGAGDSKLKCELIPCIRKSDKEVGMYDTVRRIFLTASNTDGKSKLIAGEVVGATYKNWAKCATTTDTVTIYNDGKGYKDGYRVRSGGAEAESSRGSCTGYIPVKGGDVVRLSGYNALELYNENAINVFDKDFNNLGQTTGGSSEYGYGIIASTWPDYNWCKTKGVQENPTSVYVWTVPPDSSISYIRVTGKTDGIGISMIVTINEEIY